MDGVEVNMEEVFVRANEFFTTLDSPPAVHKHVPHYYSIAAVFKDNYPFERISQTMAVLLKELFEHNQTTNEQTSFLSFDISRGPNDTFHVKLITKNTAI